jgi:hypothetical protein
LRQAIESLVGSPAGRLVDEIPMQEAAVDKAGSAEAAYAFVVRSVKNDRVKAIRLGGVEPERLQIPILALAAVEPVGMARSLLACLQANPITSLP